ncbi:MAG: hypothetical protein IJ875_03245, partial [Solobacterium sp.]|nr:hypothetical protein [Solobacterium sp.]
YYKIAEKIVGNENIRKEEAIEKAKAIMADNTLLEEIDRIYAEENIQYFYGHPVHYKIQAGDKDTALAIVSLMTNMLRSQARMIGSRINIISDIKENAYD